jgi:hypothetical protein
MPQIWRRPSVKSSPCAAGSLHVSDAATVRLQSAIFPHPLDARAPFFALSRTHGENPPGVAPFQRFAAGQALRCAR